MSKIYRNKRTKEMFIEHIPNAILTSLYDGHIVMVTENQLKKYFEEVDTAPVKQEPTVIHTEQITSGVTSFDEIQSLLNNEDELLDKYFRVGDIFFIPIEGFEKTVPIEIVHMDYEKRKMYLMSRDILAKMPMDKVDSYFEELLDKLPHDFVSHLKPIDHINKNGTHKTLISLPSIRNMGCKKYDKCTGIDDIEFNKFDNCAARCKNFEGETKWYCTDTPSVSSSTYFSISDYGVYVHNGSAAFSSIGVCPLFLLSKDQDECNE